MTVEHAIVINADSARLFRLTQDYDRRLDWDPFLRSASLVGGAHEPAVGVRAACVAKSGWSMETEYVSFNPPRATAIKMTRGPWFLRSFAGSWRFDDLSLGSTRVTFRYRVQTKPSCLAWLLTPLVASVFAFDTRKRLRALKDVAEAQEPTSVRDDDV